MVEVMTVKRMMGLRLGMVILKRIECRRLRRSWSLVQDGRDALKPGKIDNGVIPRPSPYDHDRNGELYAPCLIQPLDGVQAEQGQHIVEKAVIVREYGAEHDGNRHE